MTDPNRNRRNCLAVTERAQGQAKDRKIPHLEILRAAQDAVDSHMDLVEIYRTKVLSQKTRTIRLLGRKNTARILNTLLGYEVQASYKRIQCPDLVTARYIRLFSEIGCHSIRLPYDPTLTAEIIPDLESLAESIGRKAQELFPKNQAMRNYVLRKVYGIIRRRIKAS
jgi:hypothetical protein